MRVLLPVKGGLGNQMFCYAFYISLIHKNVNCKLLWRDYMYTYMHNGIELLNIFPNIKITLTPTQRLFITFNRSNNYFTKKCIYYLIRLFDCRYVRIRQSTPYSYDTFTFLRKKNRQTYLLDGFWQNNNYFSEISDQIKECFKFSIPNEVGNRDIEQTIITTNSIAIHVRRGDYLKKVFSNYNILNFKNYYEQAICAIKKNVKSPVFIVFSDDINWCKKHFIGDKFIFVESNNGKYSYIDMYLMSMCKHNIISNSTFSWWAAWLNSNERKIVYSPLQWTRSGIKSQSFCPDTWNFINVVI